ncbi:MULTISPECIES: Dps family protein [Rhizobium/Agrobacterium group]|uniref:DNA-binding ferritin-like protein (Oxidative damage protectant) n=2 Tax=Rhizobium/Agrobacterium group TaxID=227290 RepID=B9K2C2_ALLAM|nr:MULTISPECIES: DNA starvation/stationary phase protection protein [Rhizobium/Agrobacterium group]ACM39020.1 DNA-binding ferritin-like protein (oxidative damage protectant) [Allorhizobium ampelinum S4]MBF2718181.1 DNA starvation/stationary phase protection protein [Agrobacterium vitis]MCF1436391.1 DNA starvation/stationary phase protection protein [Allorhizobium ampelinum]MCF1449645.1 DNA starvation/stationary phase protection protein [Allorhizobium ampelinum]MCF1464516.1 DNA starvation/stati
MAKVAEVLKPRARDEKISIGLEDKYREQASKDLSKILAATYALTIKTQVYHWNVVGPLFKPIHELTEEHYNTLFAAVDIIAERIRALGHLAPVNLQSSSNFAPKTGETQHHAAIDMVKDLIADHEAAVRQMREVGEAADEAGDLVTSDMLTARLTFHEKALWMLRAIIAS